MLLPAPDGPTTPRNSPASIFEAGRPQDRPAVHGVGDAFQRDGALGRRQRQRLLAGRRVGQQRLEPLPALVRLHQRAPAGEHLLDRRQRPAEQDRGRDHAAGRELGPQDEQRAQAHDAGLDQQPRRARRARDEAAPLVGALLQHQHLVVQLAEAPLQVGQEAERGDDLPLPAHRVDLLLRLGHQAVGRLEAAPRGEVAQHGQGHQDGGAPQAEPAEGRVQEPDQGQRDRQPGRVEQRRERRAGQGLAQLRQVAQPLAGVAGERAGGEQRARQPSAEPGRQAREHAGPDHLQRPSATSASAVIRTSASSVSRLPLPSTRSKTCRENSGTASISTLIAKLTPAARTAASARSRRTRARANSVAWPTPPWVLSPAAPPCAAGVATRDIAVEPRQAARGRRPDLLGPGLPARGDLRDGVTIYRLRWSGGPKRATASILSMVSFWPIGIRHGRQVTGRPGYDVVNSWFAVPSGPTGLHLARHLGRRMC